MAVLLEVKFKYLPPTKAQSIILRVMIESTVLFKRMNYKYQKELTKKNARIPNILTRTPTPRYFRE
jgi:hypothetical protein